MTKETLIEQIHQQALEHEKKITWWGDLRSAWLYNLSKSKSKSFLQKTPKTQKSIDKSKVKPFEYTSD